MIETCQRLLRDLKSRDQRFTGMASLETTVARLASALNDFHNPDVSANATSVVERSHGDWSVKASYLFKGGWKLIASDVWGDDDDDQDESDRWKKAS